MPLFEIQSKRYIDTIDIGDRTISALIDIDGDGDQDLFLSNEQDPCAANSSRLYFFENQGASIDPRFKLVDSNYIGMDLGFNHAPAFVDIDSDGDLDLFLGEWNGNLNYFANTGTARLPQFVLIEEMYADIDVGTYSTPDFVAIDADGDFDLFVGEFLGNINFYENIGSPQSPGFVLRETQFGGIDVGEYSLPAFVDIDKDQDSDLMVGSDEPQVSFFRNNGTVADASFAPEILPLALAKRRATPVLIDIDTDGDLDLFCGNEGGGLLFFRNDAASTKVDDDHSGTMVKTIALKQNYPNPFNQSTTIIYELSEFSSVALTIYSLKGERVTTLYQGFQKSGTHSAEWDGKLVDGTLCPTGVYWVRIQDQSGFSLTRKILLLR